MPRKSSVKALPPEIVAEINRLLAEDRFTLAQILDHLRSMGVDTVSRSALGRHKQQFEKVAAKLRQSREITAALVQELGENSVEGEQGRILVESLRGMVYEHIQALITEDDKPDVKSFRELARTLKDLSAANRLNQDFELKIREEARREAEKKLDAATTKVASESAGLTPQEALERVRAIYRGEA